MTKNSTAPVAAPPAIVAEAWQQVGASFDRFCLASGVAALQTIMEQDATHLCGVRYVHKDGCNGHRWGRAEEKIGFHGGKVSMDRPRVRAAVRRWRCQAGRRHRRRVGGAAAV